MLSLVKRFWLDMVEYLDNKSKLFWPAHGVVWCSELLRKALWTACSCNVAHQIRSNTQRLASRDTIDYPYTHIAYVYKQFFVVGTEFIITHIKGIFPN
jgi:hypothetical protein